MYRIRVVLAIAALTLASACGTSSPSSPTTVFNPSPTPTPTPSSNGVSIVSGAQSLASRAYSPNPITVAVGTSVTWTNNDAIAHTVTSDSRTFDSGVVGPGASFSMMFQTAGTFPYHCSIHPGMV